MIPIDQFLETLESVMGQRKFDEEQRQVIVQQADFPLIVVAGPGTGKTTAIVGRALRLIFVDGWDPKTIMMTTFTKKAAAELRSRLLGWGIAMKSELLNSSSATTHAFLEELDLNRILTGTLDSLAETTLGEYRTINSVAPVVLDEFIADGVLLREGLFEGRMWENADLIAFARGHNTDPNISTLLPFCREYSDRFVHDLIDMNAFAAEGDSQSAMVTVVRQYQQGLKDLASGVVDFALLEDLFRSQLLAGALDSFTGSLKAIFVDEYQDTNALQESIYFHIAKCVSGAITIVGDDDQSLYRFRGGTVELFQGVDKRMCMALSLPRMPEICFLRNNYRSPRQIVNFVNDFALLDSHFQASRVPNKPMLSSNPSRNDGLPVLGIFRSDIDTLADDMSQIIGALFNQRRLRIQHNGMNIDITVAEDGKPGDCAYLAFSVKERSGWNRWGNGNQPRLPLLLRQRLRNLSPSIGVFNPRGRPLDLVPEVQQLCGLMLQCIDPDSRVEESMTTLPKQALEVFRRWRRAASNFVDENPRPNSPTTLRDFVHSWQTRSPQIDKNWPDAVPIIDLCYQLATWIPTLHDEPEMQIFLEVIARAITQSARLNKFNSRFVSQPSALETPSAREAIRNIFSPLALGSVSIDEDLLDNFPRDSVNVLTIHQAKGLEFPVIMVDVGSHYKMDHRSHRRLRFPEQPEQTHQIEDLTAPHGALRDAPFRGWRDRAFDDLVRRYYVAFSRGQALVILVGLTNALPHRNIKNVALGWDRRGVSHWRQQRPFVEI